MSHLVGVGIENFRGFGADMQFLSPCTRFNILIGANNTGKSAALEAINRFLPLKGRPRSSSDKLEKLDLFEGASGPIRIGMGILPPADDEIRELGLLITSDEELEGIRKLITALIARDGLIWFCGEISGDGKYSLLNPPNVELINSVFGGDHWVELLSAFQIKPKAGFPDRALSSFVQIFTTLINVSLPKIRMIPAARRVGPGDNFQKYDGEGFVERLFRMQSPDYDQQSERKRFDNINLILRDVTGAPDAEIQIPYSKKHILVRMNGKLLPLANLGTGIEQVILLAAFCTISENEIICIEEPEVHLHPHMQRKLVKYLREHTRNQYFISTHSSSFIDTPDTTIFAVRSRGGVSMVSRADLPSDRYEACKDLGVRASDILQANFVIWVEGPSDRIYILAWLKAGAPDLQEGLHFVIMFYGGRLLSHLSASYDDVSEFISLKNLNQNLCVVMDSDKRSEGDCVNETKRRIQGELSAVGGMGWITMGREIENYVPTSVMAEALAALTPKLKVVLSSSLYDVAYKEAVPEQSRMQSGQSSVKIDKIALAKIVSNMNIDLSRLDLGSRVSELAKHIRNANS